MSTLYIDRTDSELKIESGTLVVRRGESRQTLPLVMLGRVVIAARTRLDSSVLNRLAETGVAVILLDNHRSRRRAMLLGGGNQDARTRLDQYRVCCDPSARLELARSLVAAKLCRHRRWIRALMESRSDLQRKLVTTSEQLEEMENKVPVAENLASLRGIEGSGGRCFFSLYRQLFPAGLEFDGRKRRPPPDPVNAVLSLAYTLLHARAVQLAWAAGLDPMIGFYHDIAWGRESLACDLIEPWRPCVDAWVYGWFRNRWLDGAHFSRKGEVCRLGKSGRERFFSAFETRVRPVHRALRRQASTLAANLREEYQSI